MATTFSTLKTNVGNRVGDTSSTFASIIGTYINQRYKDVLRRCNWKAYDTDYVLTAASGTKDYTLPSNFGKELYVYDQVNKIDISRLDLENLELAYQDEKNDSGTVEYYAIFDTLNSTATSAESSAGRIKKLRLWRTPSTATCFEIPYTLRQMDLSGSSDYTAFDCERAVEYGATCDAWMYKRQFAKATAYEQLYEKEIATLMFDQENQPNKVPLMLVTPLNRDEGI